jgi:Domain of unknown function (DUF4145)
MECDPSVCENQLQTQESRQEKPAIIWKPYNIIPEKTLSLFDLLCTSLEILWEKWPKNMQLSSVWPNAEGFNLRGNCPHCHHDAAFITVTQPYVEVASANDKSMVAAARCIACNGFILAILETRPINLHHSKYVYAKHYPLGTPNDSVDEVVPKEVATDFQEALRCHWIKAHKATVLMCRRALQTSCDLERAAGKDLYTQIDDLAAKQRITEPLKKMAHRIRLLGKKGAHGDYSDIDDTVTRDDASDSIKFVNHYLEHVYILPARLDSRTGE